MTLMNGTLPLIKTEELRQSGPAFELGIPPSFIHILCKDKQANLNVKGVGSTSQ